MDTSACAGTACPSTPTSASAKASTPAIHRRRRDPTDPRPARSIPYPGPAGAASPAVEAGDAVTAGTPSGIGSSSRALPVPVMFPSIGEAAIRPRFQSGLNGNWTVVGRARWWDAGLLAATDIDREAGPAVGVVSSPPAGGA
ncbi:hypothetical protein GCM10022225_64400 [Plantactinospora mayteni]|uniref:Uncharacterized protein n=1 Tax=Plantactinospora mayteni TaxID=566021 RepID=A0ABQ4F0Q0_9ACTN|nr:hypothetical protein Pma05_70610 [Plantactinospora mayteni]